MNTEAKYFAQFRGDPPTYEQAVLLSDPEVYSQGGLMYASPTNAVELFDRAVQYTGEFYPPRFRRERDSARKK